MSTVDLDALSVVSDLHLGGEPGFQIFDQGEALAWLIRDVMMRRPGDRVGLCLNGDVVDFLAWDRPAYLDGDDALKNLEHVFELVAFKPVWDALADFVATERRLLVIVLGNHDLEVALTDVERRIRDRLCGGDPSRAGRLLFATDGTGFACTVGGQSVLCLHGNEVDPWNVVDQSALRRTNAARKRRRRPEVWEPSAGTMLVLDVMNDLKRCYPWVDLLKPEIELVPGILAAIEPRSLGKLTKLPRILAKKTADGLHDPDDFLNQGGPARTRDDAAELGAMLSRSLGPPPPASSEALIERAVHHAYVEARDPLSFIQPSAGGDMLGLWGAVTDLVLGRDPRENVREALAKLLANDRTFAFDEEDDVFRGLDDLVGRDVRFLVAGHTHLHRALRRCSGGMYFNSGTWIRLMRIPSEAFESEAAFSPVWDLLSGLDQSGKPIPAKQRMAALDAASVPRATGGAVRLMVRVRTVVEIEHVGQGNVVGKLRTVEPASAPPTQQAWGGATTTWTLSDVVGASVRFDAKGNET